MAIVEAGGQQVESQFINQLFKLETPLSPVSLIEVDPNFENFQPWHEGSLVYIRNNRREILESLQLNELVCSLSGPPAGGKDKAREFLTNNRPGLTTKIVTATARPMRTKETHGYDEVEGLDYFFYSPDEFHAMDSRGELIEWSNQGKDKDGNPLLYGMPVQSIQAAMQKSEPVSVSHLEISGWPKLADKTLLIANPPPFILSLYVLPQLVVKDYFKDWLQRERKSNWQAKAKRFAWEISQVASVADAIIVNPIDEQNKDEMIARFSGEIGDLFLSLLNPSISQELKDSWK